ncbi:MAG: glycoside hydrolase family 24 protein [Gaiellaceae bacterium]
MSTLFGNLGAFLDAIALSEIGQALLEKSDDGYNVLVGSTAAAPLLFDFYADHPNKQVFLPKLGIYSSAAGRYQLLHRYWPVYKQQLSLPDFGKAAQDAVAVCQIREQGALLDVEMGRFDIAVSKVHNIWASLPGAGYGQHENALEDLRIAFTSAGGTLA